jgi:hypothetical protein
MRYSSILYGAFHEFPLPETTLAPGFSEITGITVFSELRLE